MASGFDVLTQFWGDMNILLLFASHTAVVGVFLQIWILKVFFCFGLIHGGPLDVLVQYGLVTSIQCSLFYDKSCMYLT